MRSSVPAAKFQLESLDTMESFPTCMAVAGFGDAIQYLSGMKRKGQSSGS